MSESISSETANESIDYILPTLAKPPRKRKSTAGTRKVKYAWNDDEVERLIFTVEQYRVLWDIGSEEYKQSKLDGWRSVAKDLNIDGVDAREAKIKWAALRTTFMTNLAKLRKRSSEQGVNASSIHWKFFSQMIFLEPNNMQKPALSTSTRKLCPLQESTIDDKAFLEEFLSSSQPSTSQVTVGRRRRREFETPSPPPSPSPSSSSSVAQTLAILNNAVTALHSADSNSTFCNHLLAELRTLPEREARILRNKLGRTMFDYMEIRQARLNR